MIKDKHNLPFQIHYPVPSPCHKHVPLPAAPAPHKNTGAPSRLAPPDWCSGARHHPCYTQVYRQNPNLVPPPPRPKQADKNNAYKFISYCWIGSSASEVANQVTCQCSYVVTTLFYLFFLAISTACKEDYRRHHCPQQSIGNLVAI